MTKSKVDVLLGLQWGDEGKGKIVDYLAPSYDMVARFQGGPNAGHTLIIDGKKTVLHTIPSGIFRDDLHNHIGGGVVINPVTLCKEIDTLAELGVDVKGRMSISRRASLILPTHLALDEASELSKGREKIGSTLRGIGPTYMDKTGRNGLTIGSIIRDDFEKQYNKLKEKHLKLLSLYDYEVSIDEYEKEWMSAVERLRSYDLVEGAYLVNQYLADGKRILAEGAQGTMLDIDFGTYPFVTSSNTTTAAVCTGLGVAPSNIGEVIGISKAYCTRVGTGPFPTELEDEVGQRLRDIGHEYGATTGRPRRCGWIDLIALNYAIMLNGVTQLVITKADVLNEFETIKAATGYELDGEVTNELQVDRLAEVSPVYDSLKGWQCSVEEFQGFDNLPEPLTSYIAYIEEKCGVEVAMISTGPERESLIVKNAGELIGMA